MLYLHEKSALVLRLVLLVLLLAAQSIASAHQIEHGDRPDTSFCAICSISSGMDVPVHVDHTQPISPPVFCASVAQPVFVFIRVVAVRCTPRAPPIIS